MNVTTSKDSDYYDLPNNTIVIVIIITIFIIAIISTNHYCKRNCTCK